MRCYIYISVVSDGMIIESVFCSLKKFFLANKCLHLIRDKDDYIYVYFAGFMQNVIFVYILHRQHPSSKLSVITIQRFLKEVTSEMS